MPEPAPSQSSEPTHTSGVLHATGAVHEIRWSEIAPWLILAKALRVSLLIRVLVIAAVGVLLTQTGWWFIHESLTPELPAPAQLREQLPTLQLIENSENLVDTFQPNRWQSGTLVSGWYWLTAPLLTLQDIGLTWQGTLSAVLMTLWSVVIWALLGGAICRIAAMYLARGELLGPIRAIRESLSVWLDTIGSPLIVLLATTALSVPLLLLGVLLRSNFAAEIVATGWCFALAWGFMLAVVLVGLMLGWPLMWACLSVERSDAFDGVSRCYAYVYQRPLQFGGLVLIAAMLGIVGDTVVTFFAATTVTLTEWTLSWGSGADRALQLFMGGLEASPVATRLISGWKWGAQTIATSFPIASLWTMSVGIYLLLRRQVDATELDEITLADGTVQTGLPQENSEAADTKQAVG